MKSNSLTETKIQTHAVHQKNQNQKRRASPKQIKQLKKITTSNLESEELIWVFSGVSIISTEEKRKLLTLTKTVCKWSLFFFLSICFNSQADKKDTNNTKKKRENWDSLGFFSQTETVTLECKKKKTQNLDLFRLHFTAKGKRDREKNKEKEAHFCLQMS